MYDYHGQDRQCYGPNTQNQALGIACLSGFLWPVEWLIGIPKAVITAGHKDRLEETEAKLARINEELRKLEDK